VFLEIGQADIIKGTKTDFKHLEKFVTIKWIMLDKMDSKSPKYEVKFKIWQLFTMIHHISCL
jgi:hypothetical protein